MGQADEADGEVAQGGHDLGSVAGAQLVAVLVEDDVAHLVEPVLYGPMASGPGGDGLGLGLVHGKGADQVDHLDVLPPLDGSGASDPDHLGGAGEVDPGGGLDGLDGAPHRLPWPVSTLETAGTSFQGSFSRARFRPGWLFFTVST